MVKEKKEDKQVKKKKTEKRIRKTFEERMQLSATINMLPCSDCEIKNLLSVVVVNNQVTSKFE